MTDRELEIKAAKLAGYRAGLSATVNGVEYWFLVQPDGTPLHSRPHSSERLCWECFAPEFLDDAADYMTLYELGRMKFGYAEIVSGDDLPNHHFVSFWSEYDPRCDRHQRPAALSPDFSGLGRAITEAFIEAAEMEAAGKGGAK